MENKIITVSGTSGAGKTFFCDKLVLTFPQIREIAGVTSRPMREGEIQGKSSHFISLEEFKRLQEEKQLLLIKEFFGNKYAWFKSDLINDEQLKIMNISYKSIVELKEIGLDVYPIFIRPASEEKLKEKLKSRCKSEQDYEKRILDYYESEEYLSANQDLFNFIFTNSYDEQSSQEFIIEFFKHFIINQSLLKDDIDQSIIRLLEEHKQFDETLDKFKKMLEKKEIRRKEENESR